jgi:hypothetical protein
MKKIAIPALLAFSVLGFTSCDKAEKLLFQPFESPLNFDVAIDPVSNTTTLQSLGSTTVSYNLDEEVSSNTGGELDGSVVGAMYLNEVAITLSNSDAANDLSNFESVTLSVGSGSTTPVVFGPFAIPEGATSAASFTVANSPDIKPFFSGSNVNFVLSGKAKTATTKTLQSSISATLKFDK